jgi:hypothetical protein
VHFRSVFDNEQRCTDDAEKEVNSGNTADEVDNESEGEDFGSEGLAAETQRILRGNLMKNCGVAVLHCATCQEIQSSF